MARNLNYWSYSVLTRYESCAAKRKYQDVMKIPSEKNKYAQRGVDAHNDLENYLTKKISRIPKILLPLNEELRELRIVGVNAEEMWAVDKKWKPCGWKDWAIAWCRAKIDIGFLEDDELVIVDLKTGRPKNYEDQAELYAVMGMIHLPNVDTVRIENWYPDLGGHKEPMGTFHRRRLNPMKKQFEIRVKRMLKDKKMKPTPGRQCKSCSFSSKHQDGPCQAG